MILVNRAATAPWCHWQTVMHVGNDALVVQSHGSTPIFLTLPAGAVHVQRHDNVAAAAAVIRACRGRASYGN